jgi:hypothetical protein
MGLPQRLFINLESWHPPGRNRVNECKWPDFVNHPVYWFRAFR